MPWPRGIRRPSLPRPSRWPVRWRLTAVSSLLTFIILLVFAGIVGQLAEERLRSDFRNEVARTASDLSAGLRVECASGFVGACEVQPPVEQILFPSGSSVVVFDRLGQVLDSTGATPEVLSGEGDDDNVQTRRVANVTQGLEIAVRYARDPAELNKTINRVWLLLAGGVVGGTLLAFLAGLAVASRAMRPISGLTATARRIASTRDPSLTMPQPTADDEVAELARTLDTMLGELDAARNETQQIVQAQREFVADASHELRTPLTSILANLEILDEHLRASGRGGSEDAEIVGSALRSSKRMRRLVSDLLLLARADAGRSTARGELDLAEVVEAAVSEVRPIAGEHTLAIESLADVEVLGNADELHRLVVNLVDNGVRHTPAGTTIGVSLARQNGDAILEVADDGPGLPEGMEEQVFSRFVRGAGPADVSGDSGTGLGLAIVRAVAESHGGAVEAGRSRAGGALFKVTLPVHQNGS